MIPFDFIYCRPETLSEAVDAYLRFELEGKHPAYYSGGSETITLCRAGEITPGAVIDIKAIPELNVLESRGGTLTIGAACTLERISTSNLFPLLRLVCGRVADHTNQCRITLGGNLCGSIIYRETSLPLLISDAQVTIYGRDGTRKVPFKSVFDGKMNLKPYEILVSVHIPAQATERRYFHAKHTRNEKIDYPLVSLAALEDSGRLRVAVSGLCHAPLRSMELEEIINDRSRSPEARSESAAELFSAGAYSDAEGAGDYRCFVFKNALEKLITEAEK